MRALLFGGKLKVIAAVVGLLACAVGGSYALGLVGAPSVTGVENRFGDVNESTTRIESDMAVSNPNPIGVKLGGLTASYTVEMNGVEMARGEKTGVSIPKGNSSLHFSTAMDNGKIPAWWTSHIRNGEHTDLAVNANVHSSLVGAGFAAPKVERSIDTDVIGEFNSSERRPINVDRPLVEDPVAYIERTNATWGEVSSERTPIEMRFVVSNPKSVPITVTEVGYDVTMNDVAMGEGATERTYVIPPGGTRTIESTVLLRNGKLDEWWTSHLRNDQVTELRIDFYARIDLSAVGGGSVRIPLDGLTYEKEIETDLFGTKNATANGTAAGGADANGTAASGTTATTTSGANGGSGATPSGTPTPTSSPTDTSTPATPAETTTDDGGLLGLPVRV